MTAYQMSIIPIGELRNLPEGNQVSAIAMGGNDLMQVEKHVATVNGLVCTAGYTNITAGQFFTYNEVEASPHFQALNFVDTGNIRTDQQG